MTDKLSWKATHESEEDITQENEEILGESYQKVIEQVKLTDTQEIWVVYYQDSAEQWTPLDKIQVVEGELQATSQVTM